MKVIIIDDEPKGRESLKKMLEIYCNGIEVVAMASNIEEGYNLIGSHNPHVVFLDIEMPGGDGFSLLDKMPERDFKVIMITAFEDYAIKAIKHRAFDYILKPVDIDELVIAMKQIQKVISPDNNIIQEFNQSKNPLIQKLSFNSRLALPVKDGVFYLTVNNIMRIEADGGYSTFYTCDGEKYLVSRNLKEYEEMLPDKIFFRVHKSHLINIERVKKYIRTEGNFLEMEDGSVVEIARRKKDEFLQIMNAAG